MPKVYILPEIIIHDYEVPDYFYPHTANKYKRKVYDWENECEFYYHHSNHGYTIYIDGIEISKKKDEPRRFNPYVPNEYYGKRGNWGLFSLDVASGEHTITIEAYQESFYDDTFLGKDYKDRYSIKFYETYKKTKNKFRKELKFNVGNGNVYFYYHLEFEQYYPVLYCVNGDVYAPSNNNYKSDGKYNWFCYNLFKYSINNIFSFQQVDYLFVKNLMTKRSERRDFTFYNEPMPEPSEDDLASMHIVKSSTDGGTISNNISPTTDNALKQKSNNLLNNENKLANSQITKTASSNASKNVPEGQSNNVSPKPLSLVEQAKAQGKTIAEFIMDKPEPVKPRKRIVKKEVITKVKYYDGEDFQKSMKDFDYYVDDDEVILTKVLNSSIELVIPNGVTIIKENALGEYLDSKVIKLPYSLKVLEKGAFRNNKNIQKVEFESQVKVIEEETFFGCKNLQEVILPPSVENIKLKAFVGTSIKKILVREDILIDKDAFDKSVEIDNGSKQKDAVEKQVTDGYVSELLLLDSKQQSFVSKLQKKLSDTEEKLSKEFEVFEAQKKQEFIDAKEGYCNLDKKIKAMQKQVQELELQINSLKKSR